MDTKIVFLHTLVGAMRATVTFQLQVNLYTKSFLIFYQELLKENSNPRLKGNRKGIIVKGKEFYIPILNTFPTR